MPELLRERVPLRQSERVVGRSGGPSAGSPAGRPRAARRVPRPPRGTCPARRPGSRVPSRTPRPRATGRPVRIRSRARPSPTIWVSRTVPPSMSGTPQRRQKTPNTASASTTRRSHHRASSRPPATACPATAAITGFESDRRVGPIGPSAATSGSSEFDIACRSAPAQNVPPAPHSTATEAAGSASKARNASASSAAVGAVDGVAALGTVEDHRPHRTVLLDPDGVRHQHTWKLSPVRCTVTVYDPDPRTDR